MQSSHVRSRTSRAFTRHAGHPCRGADLVEPHDVPLTAAGHSFRVRVYPAPEATGPTLVWVHGGAFMFGDIDMPEADWVARELSTSGIPVVSVDYTLAPLDAAAALRPRRRPDDGAPAWAPAAGEERPRARFPVGVDQVVAAFLWTREHASSLGSAPDAVSLGGASAGGNLAAGATMRLRDRGAAGPASLVLAYPVLHHALPAADDELQSLLPSVPEALRLPPEVLTAINVNYAPDDLDNPHAFPGGHDLHGLPPTLIVNSETDRLRSSGEAFAAELARAAVDVSVVREPGTLHGHLNEPGSAPALRSLDRIRAWFDQARPAAAPRLSRAG
ncbi:MAG: alpha/beta hydrolase fold domain-containing protein [Actinobacteria bacterium]|nr:alpha/beta hydrolase fold domain-containing protein [Actinomycetota bacterium]